MEFDSKLIVDQHRGVYAPAEDSYLLLEAISLEAGERFLEVGTGSGLVALHAARHARTVATDANREAVRLAQANASKNVLPLVVLLTDLMAGIRGPFDVVAFNPPYLEGIPRDDLDCAWQGGHQGAEVSLRFLQDLPRVLAPRGRAYLLLSRTNAQARKVAGSRFRTQVVASRRLFFEELDVLELRHLDSSRASRISRPSGCSQAS